MAKYRNNLPQTLGGTFLTDGGLETTLIFHKGIELPYFAAFDLLKSDTGRNTLRNYYSTYCDLARKNRLGFVLESATYRASSDWGRKMGYGPKEIAAFNQKAIRLLSEIREQYETPQTPMVISGCIGPRGDGYSATELLSEKEAERYHLPQIKAFSDTSADMVSAFTMTHVEEAIGIVQAAKSMGIPVVISFTLETDGRLPSGQPLKEAIQQVDQATENGPVYFMINCAHPTHFENTIDSNELWLNRIQGIRANASKCSHAELDEAEELDDGNPEEFAQQYKSLHKKLHKLNVVGGCCGTDHRHLEQICQASAA